MLSPIAQKLIWNQEEQLNFLKKQVTDLQAALFAKNNSSIYPQNLQYQSDLASPRAFRNQDFLESNMTSAAKKDYKPFLVNAATNTTYKDLNSEISKLELDLKESNKRKFEMPSKINYDQFEDSNKESKEIETQCNNVLEEENFTGRFIEENDEKNLEPLENLLIEPEMKYDQELKLEEEKIQNNDELESETPVKEEFEEEIKDSSNIENKEEEREELNKPQGQEVKEEHFQGEEQNFQPSIENENPDNEYYMPESNIHEIMKNSIPSNKTENNDSAKSKKKTKGLMKFDFNSNSEDEEPNYKNFRVSDEDDLPKIVSLGRKIKLDSSSSDEVAIII